MHKFRISLCVFGALFLSGCAVGVPQVMGSTPAMVSLCVGVEPQQTVLMAAQAECQKYGKNAELINETSNRCVREGGWKEPAISHLQHFRCVSN